MHGDTVHPPLASSRWRGSRGLGQAIALVALLLAVTRGARADDIHVDGTCTLGDAIAAANLDQTVGNCVDSSPGADTIHLDADVVISAADTADSTYLGGAYAGLPDVTSTLAIVPGTAGDTVARDPVETCDVADPANEFRLLQVTSGGYLTLQGVTLSNGCADQGAAILVADGGTLVVDGVRFLGNTARSTTLEAQGGALWCAPAATVTVAGALFQDNWAEASTARGGALFDGGGLASLSTTQFLDNTAKGTTVTLSSGGQAYGGAAYVQGPALSWLVFAGNLARGGDSSDTYGGGAFGGALYVVGPGASLADARFTSNTARGGDGVKGGGNGEGGAVETEGTASMTRATFADNRAQGGNGQTGVGAPGHGGALFAYDINPLDHLTFSGNVAVGGASTAGLGGDAVGGALDLDGAYPTPTHLQHSTFVNNHAIAGSGGSGYGAVKGGGIYLNDSLQVVSSLFAGNQTVVGASATEATCFDDSFDKSLFSSVGYNILDDSSGCPFTATGDQTGITGAVLPLAGYGCTQTLPDGGCLPTHAIAIAGSAVDQGSCSSTGATMDARGFSRPVDLAPVNADDGCDPGAYEARDDNGNGIEDGLEVFADGFESGDSTNWSSVLP